MLLRNHIGEEATERTERTITEVATTRRTRIAVNNYGTRITCNRLTGHASNRFARIASVGTTGMLRSKHIGEKSTERSERTIAKTATRIAWIAGDHYAGIANRLARHASDGLARLTSNRLAWVTAIPYYGKASKNAGFGSRCSRKHNDCGQRGQ